MNSLRTILIIFIGVFALGFFGSGMSDICAYTHSSFSSCGNNGTQSTTGSSNGGGGQQSGGTSNPPRPCTMTLDKTLIASGTPTVLLSWTPTPNGSVSLSRGRTRLTVPNNATTYTDSVASLRSGSYSYSISYKAPAPQGSRNPDGNGSNRGSSGDGTRSDAGTPNVANILTGTEQLASHGGDDGATGDGVHSSGNGGSSNGNNNSGRGGTTDYACSVTLTIVDKITECNDSVDNADGEDSLSDRFDPGCHTDGNPGNNSSYRPLDESEVNPPADMVPGISTAARSKAKRPISVTATAENVSSIAAPANRLVFGWRNSSAGAPAPSCGRASSAYPSGSRCFESGGKTYTILNASNKSYIGNQKRTSSTRSFRPLVAGRYEVCAVADYNNTVYEGVTGERNNSTCASLIIDPEDPGAPPTPGPTITGPIELIVSPGRVRKGTETSVTWDTGGREQCIITGTNGHIIDLTNNPSSGSESTPPITSETSYTMECADDGATADGKVGIVPIIQEI